MPKILGCPTTSGHMYWPFAVGKPACFPDPQCSAQQKIRHIDWAAKRAQVSLVAGVLISEVCPNGMHTVCNSTYFVRVAAVRTKSKKEKYAIWNTASLHKTLSSFTCCLEYSFACYFLDLDLDILCLSFGFASKIHFVTVGKIWEL